MYLLKRAAFVVGAIFVGVNLINYFVLGHTGDYLPGGERMGEWKAAKIREACSPALEHPERDGQLPTLSTDRHRVDWRDLTRAVEMTAALNCYLVTHPNAICERNNRAYIVDYINRYFAKFDEMLDIAKRYGETEISTVRKSLGQSAQPRDQRGFDAGHQQRATDQSRFRLGHADGNEIHARSIQRHDRQLPQGIAAGH